MGSIFIHNLGIGLQKAVKTLKPFKKHGLQCNKRHLLL